MLLPRVRPGQGSGAIQASTEEPRRDLENDWLICALDPGPRTYWGTRSFCFFFFLLQEGLAVSCLLTARFIQPSRMTVLFPLLATRLYKQARLGEWTIPKRGVRANQFELRKGPGVYDSAAVGSEMQFALGGESGPIETTRKPFTHRAYKYNLQALKRRDLSPS